jgi:hypothetical protein
VKLSRFSSNLVRGPMLRSSVGTHLETPRWVPPPRSLAAAVNLLQSLAELPVMAMPGMFSV